jgi:hypothetical protein
MSSYSAANSGARAAGWYKCVCLLLRSPPRFLPTASCLPPPTREERKSSVSSVRSVSMGRSTTCNVLASKGLRGARQSDRVLPSERQQRQHDMGSVSISRSRATSPCPGTRTRGRAKRYNRPVLSLNGEGIHHRQNSSRFWNMHKFENQTVSREQCAIRLGPEEWENSIRSSRNVFLQDLEFVNCDFVGEGLASYVAPVNRSTATHIRVKNCAVNSFFGIGAVFEDVVVDGLRTSHAPVILNGCALRHVVLTGKCGRFLFNRSVCHDNDQRNAAFDVANAAFYGNTDWALDISTLKPVGVEIRGTIPSRLIRRNPDEHFVMTRSVALTGDWKKYDPSGAIEIGISLFLASGADDNLFVASRYSKNFKEKIEYFHRLKSTGLVT